jgi:hypothetical protein
MIRSVHSAHRVAAPWLLTSRTLEWASQAATAVLSWMKRLRSLGSDTPELRMSREWLEEHERQSRKHHIGR